MTFLIFVIMLLSVSRSERRFWGSAGGHKSWVNTVDRPGRTANGRKTRDSKFVIEAGGDPSIPMDEQPKHVRERAESARKEYFARLTASSIRARRLRAESRAAQGGDVVDEPT